jgi:hypothetical protein
MNDRASAAISKKKCVVFHQCTTMCCISSVYYNVLLNCLVYPLFEVNFVMGQFFDKKDFSKLFVQPNTATTAMQKNKDQAANKRVAITKKPLTN